MYVYIILIIFLAFYRISIFSESIVETFRPLITADIMQNFDDLDIEGRNPSHLSEEDKEKVKKDV